MVSETSKLKKENIRFLDHIIFLSHSDFCVSYIRFITFYTALDSCQLSFSVDIYCLNPDMQAGVVAIIKGCICLSS